MKRFLKITSCVLLAGAVLGAAAFAVLPLPGTVPVLMYHFVGSDEDAVQSNLFVSRESFSKQMAFLHDWRFHVLIMDEYDAILAGRRKPRGREVVITFDDGNYTFHDNAYPILRKHAFPSTIFVVSENVKTGNDGSMMADTIRNLLSENLVLAGSHSKTHPLLSRMTDEQIREELAGSKADLETLLGTPIEDFAYPSGDVDRRVIRLAQETGYRLAFGTSYKRMHGLVGGRHALTRIKITRSSDNPLIFWFEISGIYQILKAQREIFKQRSNAAAGLS